MIVSCAYHLAKEGVDVALIDSRDISEGKSAGGRHPVSPTGQSAKGLKTRDNKRTDKFIVKRRNKRKDTK